MASTEILQDRLLRDEAVAKLIDHSPWTLRQWRHQGIGPRFVKVNGGGGVRYRESDVQAWIAGLGVDDQSTTA